MSIPISKPTATSGAISAGDDPFTGMSQIAITALLRSANYSKRSTGIAKHYDWKQSRFVFVIGKKQHVLTTEQLMPLFSKYGFTVPDVAGLLSIGRNAVISYGHRKNLEFRHAQTPQTGSSRKYAIIVPPALQQAERLDPIFDGAPKKKLADLGDKECHTPISGTGADMIYCGRTPTKRSKSGTYFCTICRPPAP